MSQTVEGREASSVSAIESAASHRVPRFSTTGPGADRLWLIAALLIPLLSAIACYHYPVDAQAFFEYVGREIVAGKVLYRDIWDNKLPSIFYIDAFWHLLLGGNYVAHGIAELAVELATIAAFAVFVRREAIRAWAPATSGFAILASLPSLRAFGHTEAYALLFIMVALVAIQRRGAIAGAILLAIGTTFWIPAALTALPILAYQRDRASRLRFVCVFAATLGAYATWMIWMFGASAIHALLDDMVSYEALRSDPQGSPTIMLRAWTVINKTFLIVPLVIAAGLIRLPLDDRERVALLWLGCALAGAAINLNFFDHYFLPSTAPLVFAIIVFRQGRGYSPARRALMLLLVIALAAHTPKTLRAMHGSVTQAAAKIEDSATVGRILGASLSPNETISVYAFEPGIYLHTNRRAPGRFANALGLELTSSAQRGAREREYLRDVAGAGAFITYAKQPLSPRLTALLRTRFIAICPTSVSVYRIFLNRRNATRFNCSA